jgi:hypothetical protein
MGNLTTDMEIRFYTRQGVHAECDLIFKVEVYTHRIESPTLTAR